MEYTLFSPLNIEDCIQRLDKAIDKTNVGSKYFYGNIDGYKIKVGSRNTPYRNSFAPCFCGELKSQDAGTLITGSFQTDPVVRTLRIISFLFVIFWGSCVITADVKEALLNDVPLRIGEILYALLLPLGGFGGIIWLGKLIGKTDERDIIHFLLIPTLNIQNVETQASPLIKQLFTPANRPFVFGGVGACLVAVLAGIILQAEPRQDYSWDVKVKEFYTCNGSNEQTRHPINQTNSFSASTKAIYICGYVETSTPAWLSFYWYQSPTQTSYYWTKASSYETGYFYSKLDVFPYIPGHYRVIVRQGRSTLAEYEFDIQG